MRLSSFLSASQRHTSLIKIHRPYATAVVYKTPLASFELAFGVWCDESMVHRHEALNHCCFHSPSGHLYWRATNRNGRRCSAKTLSQVNYNYIAATCKFQFATTCKFQLSTTDCILLTVTICGSL